MANQGRLDPVVAAMMRRSGAAAQEEDPLMAWLKEEESPTTKPASPVLPTPSTADSSSAGDDNKSAASSKPQLTTETVCGDVRKAVSSLTATDHRQRLRGLRAIQNAIELFVNPTGSEDVYDAVSGSALDAAARQRLLDDVCGLCLKDVLRRLADDKERCREVAVCVVDVAVRHLPRRSVEVWLPFIIPVLMYKLSEGTTTETSEDVYLAAMRLVESLVATMLSDIAIPADTLFTDVHPNDQGDHPLVPFLRDFSAICTLSARHAFGTINECGCRTLRMLCRHLPHPMRAYTQILVPPLLPLLQHKHAKTRIHAIDAVCVLIHCGSAQHIRTLSAFREHNVIDINEFFHGATRTNYMGTLVTDSSPRVRLAFQRMVTYWMTHLHERFDYETLLMPYILTGLCDAMPNVQKLCVSTIEQLGREYEETREEELRDKLQYGPQTERLRLTGPSSSAVDNGTSPAAFYLPGLSKLYPPPFEGRPRLGSRLVIGRFLPRLLKAITNELSDWKSTTKRHSVCLLRSLMVYTEDQVVRHADVLMRAFVRIVSDEDIVEETVSCLRLFGRLCPPETYWPLARLLLHNDLVPTTNVLTVLSHVTAVASVPLLVPQLDSVVEECQSLAGVATPEELTALVKLLAVALGNVLSCVSASTVVPSLPGLQWGSYQRGLEGSVEAARQDDVFAQLSRARVEDWRAAHGPRRAFAAIVSMWSTTVPDDVRRWDFHQTAAFQHCCALLREVAAPSTAKTIDVFTSCQYAVSEWGLSVIQCDEDDAKSADDAKCAHVATRLSVLDLRRASVLARLAALRRDDVKHVTSTASQPKATSVTAPDDTKEAPCAPHVMEALLKWCTEQVNTLTPRVEAVVGRKDRSGVVHALQPLARQCTTLLAVADFLVCRTTHVDAQFANLTAVPCWRALLSVAPANIRPTGPSAKQQQAEWWDFVSLWMAWCMTTVDLCGSLQSQGVPLAHSVSTLALDALDCATVLARDSPKGNAASSDVRVSLASLVASLASSASDKAVLAQVQQRVKTYEDDVVEDVRTLAQKVMELGL